MFIVICGGLDRRENQQKVEYLWLNDEHKKNLVIHLKE